MIIYPQFEILKRFNELGGKIFTVGSDAHSPEYIADHFEDAYNMIKSVGFKSIATFRNKNVNFIDIK